MTGMAFGTRVFKYWVLGPSVRGDLQFPLKGTGGQRGALAANRPGEGMVESGRRGAGGESPQDLRGRHGQASIWMTDVR